MRTILIYELPLRTLDRLLSIGEGIAGINPYLLVHRPHSNTRTSHAFTVNSTTENFFQRRTLMLPGVARIILLGGQHPLHSIVKFSVSGIAYLDLPGEKRIFEWHQLGLHFATVGSDGMGFFFFFISYLPVIIVYSRKLSHLS